MVLAGALAVFSAWTQQRAGARMAAMADHDYELIAQQLSSLGEKVIATNTSIKLEGQAARSGMVPPVSNATRISV